MPRCRQTMKRPPHAPLCAVGAARPTLLLPALCSLAFHARAFASWRVGAFIVSHKLFIALLASVQEGIATLSSFERYKKELLSGQLTWAPMHDSGALRRRRRCPVAPTWISRQKACQHSISGSSHAALPPCSIEVRCEWPLSLCSTPHAAHCLSPLNKSLNTLPLQMLSGGRTPRSWWTTTASCCACCSSCWRRAATPPPSPWAARTSRSLSLTSRMVGAVQGATGRSWAKPLCCHPASAC